MVELKGTVSVDVSVVISGEDSVLDVVDCKVEVSSEDVSVIVVDEGSVDE